MLLQKLTDMAKPKIRKVEWIINNQGELGVLVEGVPYFLYKGGSFVYEDVSNMKYRLVGKREFGETCGPNAWLKYQILRPQGMSIDEYFTELGSSDDPYFKWKKLPKVK